MSATRKFASAALITLGGIILICGILARYADQNLLDPEAFADNAVKVLDDAGVQSEIADVIVNELERLGADRAQVRRVITKSIVVVTEDERFRDGLNAALVVASRAALEGDSEDADVRIENVSETLDDILAERNPELAGLIPRDLTLPVANASSAGSLIDAARTADNVAGVSLPLAILGGLLMIAGVVVANDRRTALFAAAMVVALAGAFIFAIYTAGREIVALQPEDDPAQDAARAIWTAVFGELQTLGLVMAGAGGLVALIAGVVSRGRDRAMA